MTSPAAILADTLGGKARMGNFRSPCRYSSMGRSCRNRDLNGYPTRTASRDSESQMNRVQGDICRLARSLRS